MISENVLVALVTTGALFFAIFTMSTQQVSILSPDERLTPIEAKSNIDSHSDKYLLIDVRPREQTDFSMISKAIAIPLAELQEGVGVAKVRQLLTADKAIKRVYVNCRRGNASQRAVRLLKDNKVDVDNGVEIKDIIGGIEAWVAQVDPTLPLN